VLSVVDEEAREFLLACLSVPIADLDTASRIGIVEEQIGEKVCFSRVVACAGDLAQESHEGAEIELGIIADHVRGQSAEILGGSYDEVFDALEGSVLVGVELGV
jgi:hypothetical protein